MEKLQINLTPNLSTLNSTVKILIFFSNYLSMKTRSRVQRPAVANIPLYTVRQKLSTT
jgi:hypothetical protein